MPAMAHTWMVEGSEAGILGGASERTLSCTAGPKRPKICRASRLWSPAGKQAQAWGRLQGVGGQLRCCQDHVVSPCGPTIVAMPHSPQQPPAAALCFPPYVVFLCLQHLLKVRVRGGPHWVGVGVGVGVGVTDERSIATPRAAEERPR